MITAQQATDIRTRNDALMAWVDSIRGKNGWASYRPEDKPADVPDVTNEERSSLEVFDFVSNPPDKYFLYINEDNRTATTWTGDVLGRVSLGCEYRDNFGGRRVPVTIHAINGRVYHGTYYKSSGNYARIRASKVQLLYNLDAYSDQEIQSFSPKLKSYIKRYLPAEYKKLTEAIERCSE
jgi:hypothetical protein